MKYILLKIPLDEAIKLKFALDHVYLTGNEHVDGVLETLNRVLKIEIEEI